MLHPKQNRREGEHRKVVLGSLFETSGDPAEQLQAPYKALDFVSFTVQGGIEAMPTIQRPLIAPAWDHRSETPPRQEAANRWVAVTPIPDNAARAASRTPRAHSPYPDRIEKRFQVQRLVTLTTGEDECHRVASAFSAHVYFRAEAAARSTEGLVRLTTACACRALVRTHYGAVEVMRAPVQLALGVCLRLERLQHVLPHTRSSPPAEAAIGCTPGAEMLR